MLVSVGMRLGEDRCPVTNLNRDDMMKLAEDSQSLEGKKCIIEGGIACELQVNPDIWWSFLQPPFVGSVGNANVHGVWEVRD